MRHLDAVRHLVSFTVAVSRRVAFALCLIVATLLVIVRTVPYMAPGVRFDADQAVVGLMAKHISEGRAFPVFFYGQSYLLAVEAYLAAPVMWLLGPTEVALKLPLVAMNIATVLLFIWRAHRDLHLTPWLALVACLPIALPAVTPGSRLMDAMGGNVEPLLYTLVLWTLRARPWAFGLALAVFVAHREFALYPAVALAGLDAWARRAAPRRMFAQWALTGVLVLVVQGAVAAVGPRDIYGPGSQVREGFLNITAQDAVSAQVCWAPQAWPARARALVGDHWPLMVGGAPGPMIDVTVNSGMGHGNPGLAPWVLALVLGSLVCGLVAWRRPPAALPHSGASAPAGAPDSALPVFLLAVGVVSMLVYGFVTCSRISQATLRRPAGALRAQRRDPGRTRPAIAGHARSNCHGDGAVGRAHAERLHRPGA